ncbi:class I SAM-dependent methyltransferase [Ferrimonas marina]|uniref:Methyltransferase domain-containing protein n=1 Tax=Ferrimonas marina TaxID=299255 RepID=A0A1M5SBB8_9GAMM|nr:class I SAM-dependent methyltransferase [Ferrimonas marina]SHH35796.1 Methyltransferase domain-containing protein [Ferrimonas marina]
MELKRTLPPSRSLEQVTNHYLVEKAIAERLKASNWEERKRIYSTMYDELFAKVPDHPRLTRRESLDLSSKTTKVKLASVSKFLTPTSHFLEFAPGDCRFVKEVAQHVEKAIGVDISDQQNPEDGTPDNFELIVYDGYNLDTVADESIDLVFSDQLIEHFHPDDTKQHFQLVHRILRPGGRYIFRTPHSLTGPHDVSRYFSDEPQCFHLKEWTYAEIKTLIQELKFSSVTTHWNGKGIDFRLPYLYFSLCEQVLGTVPKRYVREAAKYFIPSLTCIVEK